MFLFIIILKESHLYYLCHRTVTFHKTKKLLSNKLTATALEQELFGVNILQWDALSVRHDLKYQKACVVPKWHLSVRNLFFFFSSLFSLYCSDWVNLAGARCSGRSGWHLIILLLMLIEIDFGGRGGELHGSWQRSANQLKDRVAVGVATHIPPSDGRPDGFVCVCVCVCECVCVCVCGEFC